MDLNKLSEHLEYARKHELPGWLLTVADLDELLVYIGKLVTEKAQAERRLFDTTETQIAIAADKAAQPVVTVDTTEWLEVLHQHVIAERKCMDVACPYEEDMQRADQTLRNLIAHIDVHTAQAVAQALEDQQDALTEVTDQRDALREQIARERAAAPQQHDILRAVIEVVRQYPDFDGETPFGTMMDEALAGKIPALLSSIDSLAAGVKPPPQQHAPLAQPKCTACNGAGVVGTPGAPCPFCATPAAKALREAEWNAQAVLSDEQIRVLIRCGGIRYSTLHSCDEQAAIWLVREALALSAGQWLAAAPSVPAKSPDWTEEDQREQDYFDRHPDVPAAPATHPQEVSALDERAAFEALGSPRGYVRHLPDSGYGEYVDSITQAQWEGWQARAALAAAQPTAIALLHDVMKSQTVEERAGLYSRIDAFLAGETVAQVAVPEGYKLMPLELDDALWRAGNMGFRAALNEMTGCDGYVVKKTYAALLAAAPSPALPAAGGDALSQEADLPEPVYLGGDEAFGDAVKGYTAEHIIEARQQGRAAGLEEAANFVNPHGKYGCSVADGIRALNKQEPTA